MTVRVRLTLVVTAVFAVAVVLASAALVQGVERRLQADVETRLRETAEGLRARLEPAEDGALPVGPAGERFLLLTAGGDVLAASPGVPPVGPVPATTSTTVVDRGAGFTTITVPVEESGEHIVGAASLLPVQESVDELVRILVLAVPAAVMGIGWAAFMVIGRALRPVEAITAQVDLITGSTLSARVPEPEAQDEIAHLAATMNRMLARLEAASDAQQRFAADASHELRSPLTALRAELEATLAERDRADWPATAERVLAEAGHLERLVGDLLLLARLDGGTVPGAVEVDLDDLVRVRAPAEAGIRLDLQPVKVLGNPEHLAVVVRNLVANGRRHAASKVRIATAVDGDDAVLVVEDDGAGIPAADRDRVRRAFVRLDDARSRADGGSGLGLALVDRVAAVHGGSLTLDEGAMGGLRATVRLPLVSAP